MAIEMVAQRLEVTMESMERSPIDIEKGIIGSVLADSRNMAAIASRLTPEYFQIRSMRMIFETLVEMFRQQKVIDLMTVVETMGPSKVASIGGQGVLIDAFDVVSTPENIDEYCEILEDKYRTRILGQRLDEAKDTLQKEGYAAAYEKAQSGLIELSQYGKKAGFAHMSELAMEWFDMIEEIQQNPQLRERNYLPTGFADYDRVHGGLPNGMTVVAGRPGIGKTSYGMNIAVNVAKQGKDVLFFSLEMSKSQLMTRILSGICKVDSRRLEQGDLEEFELPQVMAAVGELAGLNLYIDEEATELSQIVGQIEQWRLQHGKSPDLVVIDYLGLVKVAGVSGENMERRSAGRVAADLSVYFTKKLQAPLLMLCQLNRGVESRNDKRPLLSDLRDSGEIEQAAARVDMVYRDAYYNPNTEQGNVGEIITTKNRFGSLGTTKLYFEAETTSFHDLAQ